MTDAQPQTQSSATTDLVKRLQDRAAQRRAAGEYPDDLLESLDGHLRRIMANRVDRDMSHLAHQLEAINASSKFDPTLISTASSAPGGSQIHLMLAKAQRRQTEAILQQVQAFSDDVKTLLRSLVLAVQDGNSHYHADLVGRIDAVLDRLDSYERTPVSNEAALGDLRRRVEELERQAASRSTKP